MTTAMIPDNLSILVAVIGMVVLTLVAAGLVGVYQRHLQVKRQRVHRLVSGAQWVERLLQEMAPVSLPRDVRLMLRRDIRDRYRAVRTVHRAFPAIDGMVTRAAQHLDGEGGDVGQILPVPVDAQMFAQWQSGFAELMRVLDGGVLLRPIPPETAQAMRAQLRDRQAECLFGHFMNMADQLKQDKRESVARNRIQQLLDMLRSLGPPSARISTLREQGEEAYQYLLLGSDVAADMAAAKG